MEGFDLYREAKDYYDRLIPQKNEGLILLSLYDKYGEGDFKEDDIIRVINATLKDLGQGSSRVEIERNNIIILRLQDYFLWRDGIKKVYRFKPYGVEFCKRIHKRLEDSYSPAKIKRWFDEMYNRLNEALKTDGGFRHWIEDHFDLRHTKLGEQVEILDQQVNESVNEFKREIKRNSNSKGIIQTIVEIGISLETIKQQAIELKRAFQTTYDIDDVLTEILERQQEGDNLSDIQRVMTFNDQVRSHLEQVINRIEKIKPRIREFIYDFNQRDFDRKTEQFLDVLLTYSTYSKEDNKKLLQLPKGVPKKQVFDSQFVPCFTIVPLREIGPKPPIEVSPKEIDVERRQKLIEKVKIWKYEKDRVMYWTKVANEEIKDRGIIEFSPFFFHILKEENRNLAIAVKTAHRLVRQSLKDPTLKIDIISERAEDENIPNISIWKMKIHRK